MSTVCEMANDILDCVNDIRDAIETKKGGTVSGALNTFATEITNLPSGGGMPVLPTTGWESKTIWTTHTATSDGWIKGRLVVGMDTWSEFKNWLEVNGTDVLNPVISDSGDTDTCYVYFSFVYPIHSGDTYELCNDGSALGYGGCNLYWHAL